MAWSTFHQHSSIVSIIILQRFISNISRRPDSSFMWFLNPIKSIRYIIWHNHKWTILKFIFIILLSIFLAMFFYALPGYTIKKMIGA